MRRSGHAWTLVLTWALVPAGAAAQAPEQETEAEVAPPPALSAEGGEAVPEPPASESAPDAAQAEAPESEDEVTVEAAFGEGVTIAVGDVFSLQIRARIQFRFALTFPTDGAAAAGGPDEVSLDFLIRRARIVFAGHAFAPELRYYIQLGVAPLDMERDLLIPLRDAYITWQCYASRNGGE